MAKIDIGNFGFRTPQAGGLTPTARFDPSVTDAKARVGQNLANVGARIIDQQAREDEQRAKQAENIQVMTAHATIQNGLADAFRSVDQDVLDGKADKIGATAAWKESSDKVIADNLKGLPPDRAQLVTAQVQGLRGQLDGKLFDTFRKRDQQDVAGGLVTMREQLERFASTDPAAAVKQYHAAIDTSAAAAGWTPEQAAKHKQTFVESVTFNQFRRAAQGAYQSGSTAALDEVQRELAGEKGDVLDPAKRNTLDQTIFGWKNQMEAKAVRAEDRAEREATKRFNTATDTLNKGRDLVQSGAALSPDYISTLVEQAQGTGLEPQVRALLQVQKQTSGFANMPASQRTAALEVMRSRRADPAQGFDPLDEQQFNTRERIDASLRKQVDDGNAWAAAQRVGVIDRAPVINLQDANSAVQTVQQRVQQIGAVEAWAGQKVSPLQPQEAEQVAKLVRTLKPDQAASLLGQLGGVVGDADRIAAIGRQFGDKDGTLGMAMLYANAKTTEGRYTAELILQGEQRIKDKVVRVDAAMETGWKSSIASQVRGAYSNREVETSIIEAAFKIAAATDGDVDRAVRLATGGIIDHNGGKIPLPYGMKEDDFEKRIESFAPANLAPQAPSGFVMAGPARVPLSDFVQSLPDARLVHAGQGLYNVRSGNTLVTNEAGQRITIQVAP